jgi:hypothetical protein
MPFSLGIEMPAEGGKHVNETACPSCATELADGATIAGRRELDSHLVSICRACAEIVIVNKVRDELVLRVASAAEYLSLPEKAQTLLRVAFELVRSPRRQTRTPTQLN